MNPDFLNRAIQAAVAAGDSVRGWTSPNPPVGAAIIDEHGDIVGIGATQPPTATDNAHAEIMALRAAGDRARGATAVVTLEPCNHIGRTGPCSHALVEAGISRVYFATSDPNVAASGGADYLNAHGVPATNLQLDVAALWPWLTSLRHNRPAVTAKMAHTLDGFSAAQDGSSQWITGTAARTHAHVDRAHRDAIIVGTGTVLADNPRLTARSADGALLDKQPLRVVVGKRQVPDEYHLAAPDVWREADLKVALERLFAAGYRDVLLEGGPTLIAGALAAGLVDRVHSYLSPSLLGRGLPAVNFPDSTKLNNIADIQRFSLVDVQCVGEDVLIVADVLARE
ncbi:bifunctional diaminohydroxyphosphoribosylaminopyrimidine deaminase/5-amino-6-(5-phosphoribosylamino)uracil reductase RibD [Corynebacterium epidermidicanis]|uniref:Riboflavin biosynthesis protein RibD n=1 Tax=Corynebacterium epidermidicanis TaxID=1050174 RepID=A0A0G3GPV0_9CORY|nr:bifunctional diaminohydroxyphosphoribosylaminopyrimidine deaminase/5-amino-6-(5-phosphoribosylamino)uracil reductase RibD [Corynebacterium epidermidicanis]AKK03221.1 Riboflavin biosynthesis protein RibD [Corynebacterium epidermidicanis]